ncbi:hypothetical protein BD779DRAFT_1474495 [Infundibulicybe gibba]|nr:hypothetical protein BD779DRAFT_1474495 [Infundibulicybe gibba]
MTRKKRGPRWVLGPLAGNVVSSIEKNSGPNLYHVSQPRAQITTIPLPISRPLKSTKIEATPESTQQNDITEPGPRLNPRKLPALEQRAESLSLFGVNRQKYHLGKGGGGFWGIVTAVYFTGTGTGGSMLSKPLQHCRSRVVQHVSIGRMGAGRVLRLAHAIGAIERGRYTMPSGDMQVLQLMGSICK